MNKETNQCNCCEEIHPFDICAKSHGHLISCTKDLYQKNQ